MITERVKMMLDKTKTNRLPICSEKARLMIPVFEANDGLPFILKRAMATAEYLDKRTIFIEDGELIVGNFACRPMGMEVKPTERTWPKEDWDDLLGAPGSRVYMPPEELENLKIVDTYWKGHWRTDKERYGRYFDDERMWPFVSRGFICPPFKSKFEGKGFGAAGEGWGHPSAALQVPPYETIISTGYEAKIEELKQAKRDIRYTNMDDIRKVDFYDAAIMELEAMIRIAGRFADLAEQQASEQVDDKRRKELLEIAAICRKVPAKPADTFREAMQAFFFWFIYTMVPSQPGGRFDQFMYPYYKKDLEEGRITREEALELIECLHVKIMQYNLTSGGKVQREKAAGMAQWHNFVLGGSDLDGNDLTNELTYMMLEAARDTRTTSPTLTIRVHKNTPAKLMHEALTTIRSMGFPAFVSEESYINFIEKCGVPRKDAYDFAIAGCLDPMVPGRSRNSAFGMFALPTVLELALYNGVCPKNGHFYGRATGEFKDFKTFEDFYKAYYSQLELIIGLLNEEHNLSIPIRGELFCDAMASCFHQDAVKYACDTQLRPMLFENGSTINMLGATCVIDSLVAIKKLVFDEKRVSAEDMISALKANWEGYEDIHRLCEQCPKTGNDIPEVNEMAHRVWKDYADIVHTMKSVFGKAPLPSAVTMTTYVPAGALITATPDGRRDGEMLSDGTISPAQGKDKNGPLAVLKSGMAIDQYEFAATLLNMKFYPSTLKTYEDEEKLIQLIKTYLLHGGKHIQFNIIDQEVLLDAKKNPQKHEDLVVRVAGYSSYFTILNSKVQDEVIMRNGHEI